MAEADDYESLPATTPFKYVALAGAAAGVAEHVALFPVDSVKVGIEPKISNSLRKTVKQSQNLIFVFVYILWYRMSHAPYFSTVTYIYAIQGHILELSCHFVSRNRKLVNPYIFGFYL